MKDSIDGLGYLVTSMGIVSSGILVAGFAQKYNEIMEAIREIMPRNPNAISLDNSLNQNPKDK